MAGDPAALRKGDDQATCGLYAEASVEVFVFPPDHELISTHIHVHDDDLGVLRENESAFV